MILIRCYYLVSEKVLHHNSRIFSNLNLGSLNLNLSAICKMYKVKLHIAEIYILAFICTFVILNEFLYFLVENPKPLLPQKLILNRPLKVFSLKWDLLYFWLAIYRTRLVMTNIKNDARCCICISLILDHFIPAFN